MAHLIRIQQRQQMRRSCTIRSGNVLLLVIAVVVINGSLLRSSVAATTTTATTLSGNIKSEEVYRDNDKRNWSNNGSSSSLHEKVTLNVFAQHVKQKEHQQGQLDTDHNPLEQETERRSQKGYGVLRQQSSLGAELTRKGTKQKRNLRPMNHQYGRIHEGKTYGENNSRIIDGTIIKEDQYPWLASLHEKVVLSGATYGPEYENAETKYIPSCGGALIAPNLVLTAAHCVVKTHRVYLGVHSQKKANAGTDPDVEIFEVKDAITHENFDPWFLRYDFAILILDGTSKKQPIQWNLNPDVTYDEFWVMGWGVTEPGTLVGSDLPRETEVEYIPTQICRSNYGSLVHPEMLCAAKADTDACQGDSGGPLVVKPCGGAGGVGGSGGNTTISDAPMLVGVVSWGYGCAQPEYPGVYSRLTSVISWIHASVCESSSDGCPTWYPDWYINDEDPPAPELETKCS